MKITNKKVINIVLPIIIALLFCIPLYESKIYIYGDIMFHLNRIVGLSDGLKAHTFPIYIYPYTNYGFGYGSPMFYCDLFLIPSAILYTLGVPLITTYKITLAVFSLVCAYTSFYLFRYIFKNNYGVSILCTILYCFSDTVIHYYHISNGLGNMIALSILPILILAWYKLFVEKENCWLLLGTSFALILLCHLLTFVISVCFFGLFLIIYLCINRKEFKKTVLCVLKAMLLALALGAVFFFPLIEQLLSQEFWTSVLNKDLNVNFINDSQAKPLEVLSDFVFSGTNYPDAWNKHLGTLLSVGSFISCVIYIIKTKKIDYNLVMLIVILLCLLVETNIIPIKYFTHYLPFLTQFQFVWRVNIIIMPLAIIIIGNFLTSLNKKNLLIVLEGLICVYLVANVSTIYNCLLNAEDRVDQNGIYESKMEFGDSVSEWTNYFNNCEIAFGEYLPLTKWFPYCTASRYIVNESEEVVCGDFIRNGTTITFTVDYKDSENLYLPLSWYKGYYYQELDDNGNVLNEKECGYQEYSKRVEMHKEEGKHTYRVYYKGTIIQKISLASTSITALCLVVYLIKKKNK